MHVYYLKNRAEQNAFPWISVLVLAYLIVKYGMWKASCFDWSSELVNPYFYCSVLDALISVFFDYGAKKYYEKEDSITVTKSASELRFQVLVQTIVSLVIIGICAGGFFTVLSIKNSLSNNNLFSKAKDGLSFTCLQYPPSLFFLFWLCCIS